MILAIKTAGSETTLVLYDAADSAQPIAETTWESGRALTDQLLERITSLVSADAPGLDALTGVVIFSGPGSFTSLRIGHSVANALAASLDVPVVGASGDHWAGKGITALAQAPVGRPALPHYGAEANVTRPKT